MLVNCRFVRENKPHGRHAGTEQKTQLNFKQVTHTTTYPPQVPDTFCRSPSHWQESGAASESTSVLSFSIVHDPIQHTP